MTPQALSENEYRILKLIWESGRPLTRAEILKGTEGRNWNPASIHLILNSMLSKGVIAVTDEKVTYGRTYGATLGREDYLLDGIRRLMPDADEVKALELAMEVIKGRLGDVRKLNKGDC